MTKKYQVVGIGNAIVDVLTRCDDSFLDLMGIEKGIMQLVERERGELLYGAMENRTQAPGGSVCNTLACLGDLGLNTALIGRVADDALGRFYIEGTERGGTKFVNPPVANSALPTSRSMIFVSPDGERSMNTYLGVSADISPADVSDSVTSEAEYIFLEGYLFDKDEGKEAFLTAARSCRSHGGKTGISLSDPFCVDRHRDDFRHLVRDEMDYVIGNEEEWCSLYQQNSVHDALEMAKTECDLVVCTRSGDPVIAIRGDERAEIPVDRVTPVDATGAGDSFAAGFLYGLATGQTLETSARMGTIAASECIRHIGPRPDADLKALFAEKGLI